MRSIVTEGRCGCTDSVCLVLVKEGNMYESSKVDPLRASGGSRGGDPGFFLLFFLRREAVNYLMLVCVNRLIYF